MIFKGAVLGWIFLKTEISLCLWMARTIENEAFFTIWSTVHTLTNENGAFENDDIITLEKSLQSNVSIVFRHKRVKTYVWTENISKPRVQKCPF